MKRRIGFIAAASIAGIFGMVLLPGEAISESVDKNSPDFAPGRIIVKLEEESTTSDLTSLNRRNDASIKEKLPEEDLSVVDLPNDLSVTDAVERYEDSSDVEYAEPDYVVNTEAAVTPNDPNFSKMYHLHNTGQYDGSPDADIDTPEAWGVTTGDTSVVVAVMDTGVDISHPDLNGNVWTNPDEIAGNNVDDDANGYVDDVHGWDFRNEDNTVFDSAEADGHGTHVAGTIAAEGNNGAGITGVSWKARIMPLKFIGSDGWGYASDYIQALDYAVAEGVKVSNNSWGGNGFSQSIFEAVEAAGQQDHLLIAAAGNGGSDGISDDNDVTPRYPASYDSPNVISVAATDHNDQLTGFSNYGATSVDLAAPGLWIYSTTPGGGYGYGSGTSMATPHVAGAAALVKSKFPELDDAGIKAKILSSVDKKAGLEGKMVSGGRLNAARALGATAPAVKPRITSPSPGSGNKVRDRTPIIKARVLGANLEKSDMKLYVDGRRKYRFSYYRSTGQLAYKSSKLATRTHAVRVVVAEGQGGGAALGWKFRVVGRR